MMSIDPSDIIRETCAFVSRGEVDLAECVIQSKYPFVPFKRAGRYYTPRQMTSVFLRDGFMDRYREKRLVYPPTLRLLSHYMPSVFPYHKNWKMDVGHIAYWELFPTIDHILPVARGGEDVQKNWVCCSMLTNSIKSNWLLEELGWTLKPLGEIDEWDGMFCWFLKHVGDHSDLLSIPYIKSWYHAGKEVAADTIRLQPTSALSRLLG